METEARSSRARPAAGTARASDQSRQWLLLTHHIPPKPPYLRVKVRRQLHRIGAVALKNSVYVLPPGDETREDFEWLRQNIERNGGETTLSLASFLDASTDEKIVAAFREARTADYRSIADAARELYSLQEEEVMKERSTAPRGRPKNLRRQLAAVRNIDFFDAPGREEAERAVADLETLARNAGSGNPTATRATDDRPTGRTWVTRQGVKVDRMASAWLVRRFIDAAATFKFVEAREYEPKAGEIRFDMFGGEYTHEGDHCTFETLLKHFGLEDPALVAVSEIVHDIDCKDEKFERAEVHGVSCLVDGIARAHERDEERLERGAVLFDGLYESLKSR